MITIFKDGELLLEVEILVLNVRGAEDSLGLTEEEMGWFSDKREKEEVDSDEEEQDESNQESQVLLIYQFSCWFLAKGAPCFI